jgi:predicted ATPase/DNA-binding CsgD family transcriptional regulator
MNAIPNNLPLQLSSFIGREREIAEVKRLLATARLVTLTGAGGCGKTRLSLQVAAELQDTFIDGVWFVELAALSDSSLVLQKVGSTLDISAQPGPSLVATLANYLQDKNLLLILDNCEHLLNGCARSAELLLQSCPQLRILSTSREALNIAGETTFLVPSLQIPNPQDHLSLDRLSQYESVRLFVERAKAAQARFNLTPQNATAVAQVCHQLDGIPLAIELAAARVKALSVVQVAARLNDRFQLLTSGSRTALPRQQTLRAAVDWSYELLSEAERLSLRRLSIFVDGWTLEAAEVVCADDAGTSIDDGKTSALELRPYDVLDVLSQLVNKSLVLAMEQNETERYRFLGTMRQYAHEKLLESGEVEQVRDRHLAFFTKFAEEAEIKVHGLDQFKWFDRLEDDHYNLRAALDWSLQSGRGRIAGLRLAAALDRFWGDRDYQVEGLGRLLEVLSQPEAAERTAVRAKALNAAGKMQLSLGNPTEMHPLIEEALVIGAEVGDKRDMARSFYILGTAALNRGDYTAARAYFEKDLSLSREREDNLEIGCALAYIGEVALLQGDYERAQTLYNEAVPLVRDVGDKSFLVYLLRRAAQVARYQGNFEGAAALYREGLLLASEFRSKFSFAACLAGLAGVALGQGQTVHATQLLGVAVALFGSLQTQLATADRVDYERNVATLRDRLDEAMFAKAWGAGRTLTLDQAIAEAERITAAEQLSAAPLVAAPTVHPAGLTDREVEVLRWLAQGLTDAQIATTLVISPRTVNAHLRSIYGKLDVTTRTAAARYAADFKLQ